MTGAGAIQRRSGALQGGGQGGVAVADVGGLGVQGVERDEQQRAGHGRGQSGPEPGHRPRPVADALDEGDQGVERDQAADDEQHVDRAGGMEEGAPRSC